MFPTRDQLIEHLDRHASEEGIDLRLGTSVDRIEPNEGGWVLHTSGHEIGAPQVVVATATSTHPSSRTGAGRDGFEGELFHSPSTGTPRPSRASRCCRQRKQGHPEHVAGEPPGS